MNGYPRTSRASLGCEALEGRQLLSRGMGGLGLGGMGGGGRFESPRAEFGSLAGGGSGVMFGGGALGLGGGARDPLFLLTASILNDGSGTTTPPSRSVLSSSAVQAALQTLQGDYNTDVSVVAKPTHASIGQLQDDLQAVRKGTLSGNAATTAIQNDEEAILTSMGLTSTQIGELQGDIQAIQSAIESGSGASTLSNGSTTTSGSTTPSGSTTTTNAGSPSPSGSTVQSAMETLQSDLSSDLSGASQPTYASIGQVQDDLDAISEGTLSGSQALATVKADAGAVLTGAGLSATQVAQIQSDQAAVASAIQADQASSGGSTSSDGGSPTSIAAVQATLQSVQPYLVGIPGVGGRGLGAFGGSGSGGSGGHGFGGGFGGWR